MRIAAGKSSYDAFCERKYERQLRRDGDDNGDDNGNRHQRVDAEGGCTGIGTFDLRIGRIGRIGRIERAASMRRISRYFSR